MKTNITRYIIENNGPDKKTIELLFKNAVQICEQSGITEITLLVPNKGTFPSNVVGEFLGSSASKALCDGKQVSIKDNLSLNLESSKTFKIYSSYGMLIGIYLSKKDFDLLDSTSAKAIVFLPWTESEGKDWISTWNPIVLGESIWQVQKSTLSPKVETELLKLTESINLSTGLSHPLDKKRAKEMFAKLKSTEQILEPEDIRKWAIRNNWNPSGADELIKLAQKYCKNR